MYCRDIEIGYNSRRDSRTNIMQLDHRNYIVRELTKLCEAKGIRIGIHPYHSDWDPIRVELMNLARFDVQQMPGCCAVLCLSYVRCAVEDFENVVNLIVEAARNAAFGSVAMTQVIEKNDKYNTWKLLLKHGFIQSEPFLNGKSGNWVVYLTKDLEQKKKMEGFEVRIK